MTSSERVGDQAKRQITVAGVETMYLASAALVLQGNLGRLIHKLESLGIAEQVPYINDMRARYHDLSTRYIEPLIEIYEQRFLENNSKIEAKGPTDWNHATYPDAKFSQEAYRRINKWKAKFNKI